MRNLLIPCTAVVFAAAVGLSACHKKSTTGAAASASASAAAPSASAAGSASAAPAASASAAAAPAIVKAKTEINGKSISVADDSDITAALKKHHWHTTGSGSMAMGPIETITVHAKKGKLKADISLVRPSGAAAKPGKGMKMASAKDQEADFAKKGAAHLDGNALLAVVIKGKKKVAKKLLEELIKK